MTVPYKPTIPQFVQKCKSPAQIHPANYLLFYSSDIHNRISLDFPRKEWYNNTGKEWISISNAKRSEDRQTMAESRIGISDPEITRRIFGSYDAHAQTIQSALGVRMYNRADSDEDCIVLEGEDENVRRAAEVVTYLRKAAALGDLSDQNVDYAIRMVSEGEAEKLEELDDDCFFVTPRGKPIKAKTVGQKRYVDAIRKNTIVICTGPAGTGKTYLAVAMAVRALKAHEVTRIILTRPAVEAGEKLGFLPGDLQSKIDPYLRPLYDALYEMLGFETVGKLVEKMVIEIAPLAYMRGRTLDESFIILDEAQNTTQEQMKMFLTRLGNNSRIVVTGDLTQTDLPEGKRSGLSAAVRILRNIDDIAIHEFTERDVVRHRLVQRIITAYDRYERESRDRAQNARKRFTAKKLPSGASHRSGDRNGNGGDK